MAVARLSHVENVGAKEYDAVVAAIGVIANPPKGGILHVAGPGTRGWRVFDLWESEEAFKTYERDRLNPAITRVGLTTLPHSELYKTHNVEVSDAAALRNWKTGTPVVAQIVDMDGMGSKEYDRVTEVMRTGTEAPKGILLHVAGGLANVWRVFNLWTSEQAFNDFRRDRLEPAFRQMGFNWKPRLEMFPVHRLMTPNLDVVLKPAAQVRRAGA